MIHCIGDSHSAVFSGEETMQPEWPQIASNKLPYFNSYRLGPATAYQLENKKHLIDDIINKHVKENDSILFCFGEVDIRAHLMKQMSLQSRTLEDIVKECVDRYFDVILSYKNKNINCIVWGPIASWHESKRYSGPSFGTCVERNKITKEFNRYVEELCIKNDVHFVTIFYDMINENYETNTYYLDDWNGSHMHLSQTSMSIILERFKEKNLI
jgi:hypothetical protein